MPVQVTVKNDSIGENVPAILVETITAKETFKRELKTQESATFLVQDIEYLTVREVSN